MQTTGNGGCYDVVLGGCCVVQVFQSKGDAQRAAACNDQVVKIWSTVLCQVVLGVAQVRLATHTHTHTASQPVCTSTMQRSQHAAKHHPVHMPACLNTGLM